MSQGLLKLDGYPEPNGFDLEASDGMPLGGWVEIQPRVVWVGKRIQVHTAPLVRWSRPGMGNPGRLDQGGEILVIA